MKCSSKCEKRNVNELIVKPTHDASFRHKMHKHLTSLKTNLINIENASHFIKRITFLINEAFNLSRHTLENEEK